VRFLGRPVGGEAGDAAGPTALTPSSQGYAVLDQVHVLMSGRCCTGYEFSTSAAHSCCIYDKTKGITVSRKDWMRAVWKRNGWDDSGRVTRVEFRYKR